MAKIIRHENVKHSFTKKELEELGQRLAQETQSLMRTEEEKKSVMSDYKSKAEAIKANISRYSTSINNGFEMRSLECEIRMNKPKNGMKTVVRLDTGEKVSVVAMSAEERQEELFDKDERKKKVKRGKEQLPPSAELPAKP